MGVLLPECPRNKICPPSQRPKPTVRKVPAGSVPYGESISRNGRTVWIALDGERVVCVAATAEEARHKFNEIQHELASKKQPGAGG